MSAAVAWLYVAGGVTVLVLGGEAVLRGAVRLAALLKLTPAVIGLTVVAMGTSIPELAVSGTAAIQGQTEIAVANVFGSCIFNVLVIVGLCALLRPFVVDGNTVKIEYPVLIAVTGLCAFFVANGEISQIEGGILLLAYIGIMTATVMVVRKKVTRAEQAEFKEEVEELADEKPTISSFGAVSFVAAGIGLLALGSSLTIAGAVELAKLWGWSEHLIGLTIVSAGTGLPEVVASVVSSIRGRSDVALGNVIGSNIFNILVILGITGAISPLPVQPALIASDLKWLLGATLILLPMIASRREFVRWQGAFLIAGYCAYLWVLIQQGS